MSPAFGIATACKSYGSVKEFVVANCNRSALSREQEVERLLALANAQGLKVARNTLRTYISNLMLHGDVVAPVRLRKEAHLSGKPSDPALDGELVLQARFFAQRLPAIFLDIQSSRNEIRKVLVKLQEQGQHYQDLLQANRDLQDLVAELQSENRQLRRTVAALANK